MFIRNISNLNETFIRNRCVEGDIVRNSSGDLGEYIGITKRGVVVVAWADNVIKSGCPDDYLAKLRQYVITHS